MATVELTNQNFAESVSGDGITIVDFWAEWCGPCRMFGPIFEEASEKHPDISFGKVNTEEQRELADQAGISSIPTLMVFRENVLLYNRPGALPGQGLEELIAAVRDLDMVKVHEQIAAEAAE